MINENTEDADLEALILGDERSIKYKRIIYSSPKVQANLRKLIPYYDKMGVFDWIYVLLIFYLPLRRIIRVMERVNLKLKSEQIDDCHQNLLHISSTIQNEDVCFQYFTVRCKTFNKIILSNPFDFLNIFRLETHFSSTETLNK